MHAEQAYLFRHVVLREAAYQIQLPSERARLHELALALIENIAGGRPPSPPPLDEIESQKPVPHPSDAFALELSVHAAGALGSPPSKSMTQALRLYLRRAAEFAEQHFKIEDAILLWQKFAEVESANARGQALRRAGYVAHKSGRLAQAESLYDSAVALHRASGDRRLEGIALGTLAIAYDNTGRVDRAEGIYEQALVIHREVGNRRHEGATLENLAALLEKTGRREYALDAHQKALAIFREIRDSRYECIALSNLSGLYLNAGDGEQGERFARQAQDIAQKHGFLDLQGATWGHIANAADLRNMRVAAQENHHRAIAIFRQIGSMMQEGVAVSNLGASHLEAGEFPEAEEHLHRALAIHREVGNRRFEGVTLNSIGSLQLRTKRFAQAEQTFIQAMSLLRLVGDRGFQAKALRNMGHLYAETGRAELGLRTLEQSLAIVREVGIRSIEGYVSCELAIMLVGVGAVERARVRWREGTEILQTLGKISALDQARQLLAVACAKAGVPGLD